MITRPFLNLTLIGAVVWLCETRPALAQIAENIAPIQARVELPSTDAMEPLRATTWPATRPRQIEADALPVTVDFDGLRTLAPLDRLALQHGGDRVIASVRQINRRSDSSWSLIGQLENDPDGFVILCVEQDAVAGLIQSSRTGKLYKIAYVAQGVHEIVPVRPLTIPDCNTTGPGAGPAAAGPIADAPPTTLPPPPGSPEGGCLGPEPNGDVIIYYTPLARAEAGGVAAMDAECQLAVDTANQTYVDSLIGNQLTLVFRGEIAYTETGAVETDRNRLKGTSDGHMDQVHAERNAFGADFVSLFVRDAGADACGIAYCTPSGSDEGFCVVNRECASTNFSFAHEIGHLQGCAHNEEDAGSGCNQHCYSYGHRFIGNTMGGLRTVMSYNTDPPQFTRIGRWSHPNVTFDGQPCGIWTGDCDDDNRFNASTVSLTAANRETWRNPRFQVWVERFAQAPFTGAFFDPFPTVVQGVTAVFDGVNPLVQPVLHIKAQNYPETMTISKRMTITACGGTAVIGG